MRDDERYPKILDVEAVRYWKTLRDNETYPKILKDAEARILKDTAR